MRFFESGSLAPAILAVERPEALPDIVQVEDYALGALLDASVFDPVQPCLGADTGDFLTSALGASRVGGIQWGLPLGWNGLLLLFDPSDLIDAGLPPTAPRTLAELTDVGEAVRAAGGPSTPVVGPLHLFELLGAAGATIVDRDDGHAGSATRSTFGDGPGAAVFEWADDLVERGLFDVLDPTDPLAVPFALAENTGTFGLVDARELWQIGQALRQGQAPGLELTVAAIPGVDSPGLAARGGSSCSGAPRTRPVQPPRGPSSRNSPVRVRRLAGTPKPIRSRRGAPLRSTRRSWRRCRRVPRRVS